jgi:hypothetical protein
MVTRVDVECFNVTAEEPEVIDAIVQLTGAEANAETSAVSANELSNSADVDLTGAGASAVAGVVTTIISSTGDRFNPDFPRVAAARIGKRDLGDNFRPGQRLANPEEVANCATTHFLVCNPQQGRGQEFVLYATDLINRQLAANPDQFIYFYTDLQEAGLGGDSDVILTAETGPTGNGGTWFPNDWWARNENGNQVENFPGNYLTNVTANVTPSTTAGRVGLIWPEVYADLKADEDFDPHNFPTVRAHVYNDVNDYQPRKSGVDTDRSGSNDNARNVYGDVDSQGNPTESAQRAIEHREGHRIYSDRLRSKYGQDFLSIGNNTTWGQEYTSPNPDDAPPIYEHYAGMHNGAWMEGQSQSVGRFPFSGVYDTGFVKRVDDNDPSSAVHGFGTWRRAQNQYLYLMRHTLPPKHVMNQWEANYDDGDLNPIVGDGITAEAMRVARWGICSTLMDDGYIAVAKQKYNHMVLFDEYGTVNQGTTGLSKGYLGQPVDASQSAKEDASKQSSVWSGSDNSGIFKREFDNGVVLVNTTKSDTGSITVPVTVGADESNGELEAGKWRRINGVQDSSHNNGQLVNSNLTIDSMDGYILLRV